MGFTPTDWGQGVIAKVLMGLKVCFIKLDLHRSALGKCSGRLGPPTTNRQVGSPGLRASRHALSNGGLPRPGASPAHGVHPYRLGPRGHGKSAYGPKSFFFKLDLHRSALGQCSGRLGPPTTNRQVGSPGLRASRHAISNCGLPRPGASPAHGVNPYKLVPRGHSKSAYGPKILFY